MRIEDKLQGTSLKVMFSAFGVMREKGVHCVPRDLTLSKLNCIIVVL